MSELMQVIEKALCETEESNYSNENGCECLPCERLGVACSTKRWCAIYQRVRAAHIAAAIEGEQTTAHVVAPALCSWCDTPAIGGGWRYDMPQGQGGTFFCAGHEEFARLSGIEQVSMFPPAQPPEDVVVWDEATERRVRELLVGMAKDMVSMQVPGFTYADTVAIYAKYAERIRAAVGGRRVLGPYRAEVRDMGGMVSWGRSVYARDVPVAVGEPGDTVDVLIVECEEGQE